ncbi:MAG TPA: hypothetical protein VJ767_01660 [Nitrososphaeraceae archaeon]|nr:hypothetical protein [Nitrososphaeraceae archaeon]
MSLNNSLDLISKYGKYTVYIDGGAWNDETCNVIGLRYYLPS